MKKNRPLELAKKIFTKPSVAVFKLFFSDSKTYWERRYLRGKNSGKGSYGKLAEFKANIINSYIEENDIKSVIEFGCGDGNQLTLGQYQNYIGLDVSRTALDICKDIFKEDRAKSFFLYDSEYFIDNSSVFKSDLALSLDVIYHLIEDEVFELYMNHLFDSANRHVIIYSSNGDLGLLNLPHVRHRCFTKWIEENRPDWGMIKKIPNKYPLGSDGQGSFADFFIYKKKND